MPRAGLDSATVIERAAQLLDENPAEGLNLPRIAESFGVRVPSLYKHIDGMTGLRRGVTILARRSLSTAIAQATIGRSKNDAITILATTYRAWALAHPGQYPLTIHAPVATDEEDMTVSMSLLTVIFAVLDGYNLRDDDAVDATRFLRSTLHGFVAIETGGGFEMPRDLERSYARLVDSLVTALSTWNRQ
ncbi:TetR/AcrR family transcriptional regulator [Glaciihabitans sp. dw_435]|uniref:TetR/AcrR family transcriptional regulator n=1 Tax=Glaciihabitans sp. dw_435 TaxID=2720081 RepID=UPI001BD528DC|nr:TetR/AcrR family transcriptional regulator [Glaciihabitans sp. dw_435]